VNREIFQKLRGILVKFYPEEPRVQRVIHDADIDSSRIHFGTDSQSIWHSVLTEAEKMGRVDELLRVVEIDYGTSQEFRAVYDHYYHSIGKSGYGQTSHRGFAAHIDITKLKFSDRKQECDLFHRILCHESLYRGLIIHSNGQSRAGKSTLLTMFDRMCQATTLPWPTTAKFFDARRIISWQEILDSTVKSLGETHFPNYLQLRSGSEDSRRESEIRHFSGAPVMINRTFTNQFEGVVHSGLGDTKSGHSETIGYRISAMPEWGLSEHSSFIVRETRQQLTRTFLRELNNLPEKRQVVWLIDTAENLGPENRDWVEDIFWEISEANTQRLILVVAGKEQLLADHPAWSMYVQKLPIAFTVDVVAEIVATISPDWDQSQIQTLARTFYRAAKGDPMMIMMQIDIFIEEQGIVYGEPRI
jgi:hypothetical protein